MNKAILEFLSWIEVFWKNLFGFFKSGLKPWRLETIATEIGKQGLDSLPIILLATASAGMVISQEMAFHMQLSLQSLEMIPGFTTQFIVRELGIAIPALLIVSKSGASMTAEIGTMRTTEQIDALRILRISISDYLIFPRTIASILSLFCLTLSSLVVTLIFAILAASFKFDIAIGEYLIRATPFLHPKDLGIAGIKACLFGFFIPMIACTFGLRAQAGAEGVGQATTQSVVVNTLVVIFLDFLVTFIFYG